MDEMKLDIYQVDAFTSEAFHGNPAAVVPLTQWLPDETMLAIAAENNLAETAFFVKSGDAYELRWFTPAVEVPLCGHATLASSHVIFNELGHTDDKIIFKTRQRGDLSVTRDGGRFVLDFPAYPMKEIEPITELASGGNAPLKYFESQDNMLLVRMDSQKTVTHYAPDIRLIESLPYREFIITAKGDDCDFASRMFAPKIGIPEDPVTGAIHCSLIPYWAEALGKAVLFARQMSKRGGELFCEIAGDRVKIGGNAVLYLKGEIIVDAAGEKSVGA
jgi:predicted PhzF superfamily epimerase YddE/YHI9